MKRRIDKRKTIASCHISNVAGIAITELTENYICFNIVSDTILSSHKKKLYSGVEKKGLYFLFGNSRMYLSEFIRI